MLSTIRNRSKPLPTALRLALQAGYVLVLCFVGLFQAQRSAYLYSGQLLPAYLGLNLVAALGLFCLTALPFRRLSTGGMVFSTVLTIVSIVNFYTIYFHGSLFTFSELANAGTALNVLGQYNFFEGFALKKLVKLSALLVFSVLLSLAERYLCERTRPARRMRRAAAFLLGACCLFGALHIPAVKPLLKEIRGSWNLTQGSKRYGYLLTLYDSMGSFRLAEPEGYDISSLDPEDFSPSSTDETVQPDIFLILNESFFDLNDVARLKTDADPLAAFYAVPGARYGRSVSRSGGGTNLTEFELLTGIPQSLVGATPFNVLDMTGIPTIVSQLHSQGYYTIGTHCEPGQNYNRLNAYPQIGFDEIYFRDDYENPQTFGSRLPLTDRCVYENMLRWYEAAAQKGAPVFTYCLTDQNHGDWKVNAPEENLVHVDSFQGRAPEAQLNEFLSCIQLSGDAFAWLCSYLENADRPVIVCMLGDHSPSFIDDAVTKDLGPRSAIAKSGTPLVLWANFDLALPQQDLGSLSASAAGPMLMKAAGVRYSPFFQYILDLSQQISVVTGWGEYQDAQGNIAAYLDRAPGTEAIWDYLYLAYNAMLPDRESGWFSPVPEQ